MTYIHISLNTISDFRLRIFIHYFQENNDFLKNFYQSSFLEYIFIHSKNFLITFSDLILINVVLFKNILLACNASIFIPIILISGLYIYNSSFRHMKMYIKQNHTIFKSFIPHFYEKILWRH